MLMNFEKKTLIESSNLSLAFFIAGTYRGL